jgi:hypothetical protein
MRRSVLMLLLAACDAEGDQRARCDAFAKTAGHDPSFVEQCVKQRWSTKQMECHARNGGMLGAFCDD